MPKINMPKIDMPKIHIPKINMPKIHIPKIHMPKIDMPIIHMHFGPHCRYFRMIKDRNLRGVIMPYFAYRLDSYHNIYLYLLINFSTKQLF